MKSRTFAEKCCNMAKHPLWKDEYWLLLLQLYQKKPMGVKPLYSKGMVNLALELHFRHRTCKNHKSNIGISAEPAIGL